MTDKIITTELYGWRAYSVTGEVFNERPDLSSDHLPRHEIFRVEYIPQPQLGAKAVTFRCDVDLDGGERFVRYWTTITAVTSGRSKRLYVLGWQNKDGHHALFYIHPIEQKIAMADDRKKGPPMNPDPFGMLDKDKQVQGGPGTWYVGWKKNDSYSAFVYRENDQTIVMRSKLPGTG